MLGTTILFKSVLRGWREGGEEGDEIWAQEFGDDFEEIIVAMCSYRLPPSVLCWKGNGAMHRQLPGDLARARRLRARSNTGIEET